MADNSGGFVVAMCFVAEILKLYDGDHADVFTCLACNNEFRWKDFDSEPPTCIRCGSIESTLIRSKSEF